MKKVETLCIRMSKNLRTYRKVVQWTQAELAREAGVTVETVARIERLVRGRDSANGNPTLATLEQLSGALGIEPAELLGTGPARKVEGSLELLLANASPATRKRARAVVRALVAADRGLG